ncbi:MAG TPA: GNAT family N-acetyltransferase [Aquihabitans sp.]|jgi:GNAT superfamily N-acetyltransferase|nr:GNAT family N-acetyltransferase [Aquihabitans sp.]
MFTVRRLAADEGPLLRATRLAALADAPGDATTTLARAEAHDDDHWTASAAANASGPLQATFLAEAADVEEPVGMVGAYANRDGVVNVVGLWSAPGHRDVGVATALLEAVAGWARGNGDRALRLWVVERNEFARRFYEGEGFRSTGTDMPYELDPRIRQCEMVRDV